MKSSALTIAALALVLGAAITTSACVPRTATGGAVAGAAAVGGAYEYQNKRAMDQLEREYRSGQISQTEYERRKREISRRSLVY
jgi:osmotically-inducible protein OsmY